MRTLATLIAGATLLGASAGVTVNDIAAQLIDSPCSAATVRYEVLMPSAADPVVYTIELLSMPNLGDTLAPADYLIDWTLPRGEAVSRGFCSYADGVHFRYRDTKLQEYHYAEDPRPFIGEKGGVQMTAQFADLLPQFIGKHLVDMQSDTTYHSNFDARRLTLSGVQSVNGYDALEYTYTFDAETFLPLQIDMEYNPASISEQTVTAYFDLRPRRLPHYQRGVFDRPLCRDFR